LYFLSNSWVYETRMISQFYRQMSQADRDMFEFHPKMIKWDLFSRRNMYGIMKYIIKQDITVPPDMAHSQIISKNKEQYFQDIRWTYQHGQGLQERFTDKMCSDILSSHLVQQAIQDMISQKGGKKGVASNEEYDKLYKEASKLLRDLAAKFEPKIIKFQAYVAQKFYRRAFDQIIINETQVRKLKDLVNKSKEPVVLVPTHKSYMDFWLLTYICYYYDIDLPFVCGNENFMNIALITRILRGCGGFFVEDKHMKNPLFQAILEAYITALLKNRFPIEIYVERQRGKLGKILKPKDQVFNYVVEAYFKSKGEMRDVKFVPITVNYERVFEGQSFPLELLGEERAKISVQRAIRGIMSLNNKYGRVTVNISDPVSLKQFSENFE